MTGSSARRGTAAALAAGLLATLISTAVPASAARPAPPPPSDAQLAAAEPRHELTREQFYFVLPDRFANGDTGNDEGGLDGDRLTTGFDPTDKGFYQGGDLAGLTRELDYVKGLGTTALWLAPVFKNKPVQGEGDDASAGYHGYWITDFTQIDPHFGTNEDLRTLIKAAKARGMKVFFDVITNHTADVIGYEEDSHSYLSKGAFPYVTKDGKPFDDADYAGATAGARGDGKDNGKGKSGGNGKDNAKDARFPAVDRDSFPRTPVVDDAEQDVKVPAWLNDPTMYHNRGDSTFAGESSTHGDFSGLDDLWTERPEVVTGMERIYQRWVRDFGIDGFRIDTVKHVNMEFWTQWATALDAYAARRGNDDFFMFGEVYSADPAQTSPYVTRGRLDSTLDFPFQDAARGFASRGTSADRLTGLFAQDYRYTTGRSNAYGQVTFLGNHDMGRIGHFVTQDNPDAGDAELLRRATLANELMFLTRGNPVVYYGDEQGFTGAGGDKDARQTLFASRTPDYLDESANDQIGTARTHAKDAYDTRHPLYRSIAALSKLTRRHPALRDGTQVERYADDGPGVYAFSRFSAGERPTEYVVALNNAGQPRTVTVPTGTARAAFRQLHGGDATVRSTARGAVEITVPALSAAVYRAAEPLGRPAARPRITLTAPAEGATGTVELSAEVDGGGLNRVVFAAQTGDGRWQTLGSADHAPYKVTQYLGDDVPAGTPLRYKAVVVDHAGRTASALAQSRSGTPPAPEVPSALERDWAVVHYHRPDGDYDAARLVSGDRTAPFTGRDAYGAFAWLAPGENTGELRFTIEHDGAADGGARTLDLARSGEVWVEQGDDGTAHERPQGVYPPQDPDTAVIHYHRPDGDYDGWGLHTWTGAAEPTDWASPVRPVSTDAFGAVYEVPLAEGATSLSYIVHRGDEKDEAADQSLVFASHGREAWKLSGTPGYLLPTTGSAPRLDLATAEAQWIDRNTVAWDVPVTEATSAQLLHDREGRIALAGDGTLTSEGRWLRLTPVAGGLTDEQRTRYPHLKDHAAFTVDPRDRDRVREALRGQVVATQRAANGALLAATGVQLPGVLDDVYGRKAAHADLGPVFDRKGRPTLSVWAPTARSVALELDGRTVRMRRDDATGVWSARGNRSWTGKPYRFRVTVWAPSVRKVVTNRVTDPYSTALTTDSEHSLVVDLDDPRLAPRGWESLRKPAAVPMRDARIQELHVRDFSVADRTAGHRGTYLAFTDRGSDGSKHLRALADAGTTHVHLLPTYDLASVPERRGDQARPDCDLASLPAASDAQQTCVGAVRATDAYNWGYDPLHYTVPEGSYATDPDGPGRTREYRRMVQSLNGAGLGVVLDVVYNHTYASGQDEKSVLDRIVPGYYHRLLDDGTVATSTCCPNTAPEHTMMGKLTVDSIVTWARQYKVDGFRFDLMGHHPKENILAVRKALDALTLEEDGVDGSRIILYGEGWNFGEVADDSRFTQATQANMAGTGIATFSDRARDAVRGGGPFDEDPGVQGFASGLHTDANGSADNGTGAEQRARLLHYQDLIKVGLTGNLADYAFTDSAGRAVTGAEVDYNGAPAGYAADPGDALAYADAHDNETLYDALTYKLPAGTAPADRARMQVLAMATAVLSQGPSLSQAGTDLLRSKSLDRNSYDSGDWYNAIHWDCGDGNGFGRGLPPAWDNEDKWPYAAPLLTEPSATPGCAEITGASAAYRDLLRIRSTEDAFSLASTEEVQRELSFPLSGPDETPGVITMRLGGLVVVFNATPQEQGQRLTATTGDRYRLHDAQAKGSDEAVKAAAHDGRTGTFTVPARTVAVFTQA
ncbi:pullulanase-type alpha-1,6-glucosidase [Streptomyces sp. TRM 70351]|uniref:pullulanase-type alpha-1,6-glucosidase n=1 Tax=Streptomyces sp. TRM 70351 TaxID=3116552 RepID=UPI002E7B03AD|nr:pullulanase-type alpha-1,6-glucosidase [Streptomyces sp. TRM 70351]MEE1928617.1 pullulanase-type alpha-1,6-glucosidase [Streptomyces sp. TRM 70351]